MLTQRVLEVVGQVLALVILLCLPTVANDRVHLPLDSFRVKVEMVSVPPVIDGKLDDECWHNVKEISGFSQFAPNQEAVASEETKCYFARDDEHLFFSAICLVADPSKIAASISNRDGILGDDWIMLMLDSYGDQRSAYEFILNPHGIQADGIQYGDHDDMNWDAVWDSHGVISDSGWQVEMAIPFKAVRFSTREDDCWRFEILRKSNHNGEMSCYVPLRISDNSVLSRCADLDGLKDIKFAQNLKLLPYVTDRWQKSVDQTNELNLGADLKYSARSNLVFDATYNPDFSQVEADIDQINLSPYELFLTEKRPFFLEKMDVYNSVYTLFYTRRIVRPDFGFRMTGKFGGYQLASLYSLDGYEDADDNHGVFRLTRDLFSRSKIGAFFTVKRAGSYDNSVGSLDWRMMSKSISFYGQVARSWTDGLDGPSWIGYSALLFDRSNVILKYGRGFAEASFNAETGFVTPIYSGLDFEPISYRENIAHASYTWQLNNRLVRRISPNFDYSDAISYGHDLIKRYVYIGLSTEFQGNYDVEAFRTENTELWELHRFHQYSYGVSVSANPSKLVTMSASVSEGKALDYWDVQTVWQRSGNIRLILQPVTRLQLAPSIEHVSQFESRGGKKRLSQSIYALRMTYGHSDALFFKLFMQHSDLRDDLVVNTLVGYTFLPGSVFYLAYNSEYEGAGGSLSKQTDIVFAKLSYLVGL